MKKSLIFIISFFLISNPLFANEDLVVPIDVGEKARFSGFLFSREAERKVRYRLIETEGLQRLNISLETSLKLSREDSKLCYDRNNDLSKNLNDARQMTNWEKFAWFTLGIVTTTAVLYGLKQISR